MKERGMVVLAAVSLILSIAAISVVALMNLGVTNGSIDESKLADNAVTNRKIADDSVNSENIIDHAIVNQDLSEALIDKLSLIGVINKNSITGDMIVNGTITSDDIANNTIKNADISAGAVGASKLANDSVTADKIASGAVTWNSIASKPLDIVGSGIIKYNGSIYEHYNIEKVTWDSTNKWYVITIDEVSYNYKQHMTIVSPIGSEMCTAATTSNSGKLRVTLFDNNGNNTQNDFSLSFMSMHNQQHNFGFSHMNIAKATSNENIKMNIR